jgi:DNA-binding MarR family transcriptional regulator
MKACSGCKQKKPLSEFYNSKNQKDGKDYYCKECRRVMNQESRARQTELCSNCGERTVYATGLCERCYAYRNRTGMDRPDDLHLSNDEVVEMAADLMSGQYSITGLGEKYDIISTTVKSILTGKVKRYAEVLSRLPDDRIRAMLSWLSKRRGGNLSPRQVYDMRELRKEGKTLSELAQMFDVDQSAVSRIVRGESYPKTPGPISEKVENPSGGRPLNDDPRKRILVAIALKPNISYRELAEKINKSLTTVSYHLDVMESNGWIKRNPGKHRSITIEKTGKYIINKMNEAIGG